MAEAPGGFIPNIDEKLDFSKMPVSPEVDADTGEEVVSSITESEHLVDPYEDLTSDSEYWKKIFEAVEKEAEVQRSNASAEARKEAQHQLKLVREQIIGIAMSKDELTGLDNLQSQYLLNEKIKPRLRQALRGGSFPTFLYLDLDGFKGVNDIISHQAGDVVLYEFGQAMHDVFREEDIKLREGGDEFGALLFNTDAHNRTHAVAIVRKLSARFNERLRAMPEKAKTPDGQEIPFPGKEIANMVAFSAATVEVTTDDIRDAKLKADQLLKKAKGNSPREEPTGWAKVRKNITTYSRRLRGLPDTDVDGKNYLVLEDEEDIRYEIEDNPDLKFKSKR